MNWLEGIWVLSQERNMTGEGVCRPSALYLQKFYDVGRGHRAPRGQGERNVWWLHQSLTHRRQPLSSQHQTSGPSARLKKWPAGNSLVVLEWLGLCTFTAEGVDSILSWGTKILQAVLAGQQKKQKKKDRHGLFPPFLPRTTPRPTPVQVHCLWPWSDMWSAWASANKADHLTPTENLVPRRRSGPWDRAMWEVDSTRCPKGTSFKRALIQVASLYPLPPL